MTRLEPVHPGEVLKQDFMAPLGLSDTALARAIGVTPARVNEIVRGRRGITAERALRLARHFGTDPHSWMNLQTLYELALAERNVATALESIHPRRGLTPTPHRTLQSSHTRLLYTLSVTGQPAAGQNEGVTMRRLLLWTGVVLAVLLVLIGLAVLNPVAASRVLWPAVEKAMLDEPFLGVTTDGEIEPGLFRIEATGVSTEPIRDAAVAFLASLTPGQRDRTVFPVDDLEWRRWSNIHIATRQGVGLLEMDAAQTAAAFGLMAATLSARGFETSRDIMRLEGHLADLMDDHDQYGEQRYWFTVMGEPSENGPWGWQIDGHHLVVNCFVLGDQVVLTPTFMGSEPMRADTGPFAGTAILEEELAAGLALVNALDEEQRAVAIVDPDKARDNARGQQFQDNAVVPYEGLRLGGLDDAQRELALELVGLYTGTCGTGTPRSVSRK